MNSEKFKEIIKVEKLVKKFNGFTAVNNISFSVTTGEIFAFLGPNGAGKSTTIKMLTTLLAPTEGAIKINGYNPVTEQVKTRSSFGIVFQDPSLDDQLTAYENMIFHAVLYGVDRSTREKRIQELLKMVGLWDRKSDLIKKFSGGMKRRLEIARGLLHAPRILFLDEPTLGLDPQTRNYIWDYIRKQNKENKITVFFTTHYMDEAERYADRIAIINSGKIISQGSPAELKNTTNTDSVEEAFLSLTGREIHEEAGNNTDKMRMMGRLYRK